MADTSATRYTRARHEAAMRAFEAHGHDGAAAEAAGVGRTTIRRWRHGDKKTKAIPGFDAEALQCIERCHVRVGGKALSALERDVDLELSGARHPDRFALDRSGQPVLVEKGALHRVSDKRMAMALARLDPRFTHPRQETHMSGQVKVETTAERMKRVARMELEAAAKAKAQAEGQSKPNVVPLPLSVTSP